MVEDNLIEFFGTECIHCRTMQPLIEQLQKETGLKVNKIEVWHNEANARLMQQLTRDIVEGFPSFSTRRLGSGFAGQLLTTTSRNGLKENRYG